MAHENNPIPIPESDVDRYRLIYTTLGLASVIHDNYPALVNSEQPVPYEPEEIEGEDSIFIRHPYHPLVDARFDRKMVEADFLVTHQNILIDIHDEAYYREFLHSEEDIQQLLTQHQATSSFDLFTLPIDTYGGDASSAEMGLQRMGMDDLEDALESLYRVQQSYRERLGYES